MQERLAHSRVGHLHADQVFEFVIPFRMVVEQLLDEIRDFDVVAQTRCVDVGDIQRIGLGLQDDVRVALFEEVDVIHDHDKGICN